MSESETGVMTSLQHTATTVSEPAIHNMRLAYSSDGAAVYKPVAGISPPYQSAVAGGDSSVLPPNLNVSMSDPVKKKRGRPRKYGPGGTITLALTPPPAAAPQSTGTFSPSPPPFTVSSGGGGSASPSYLKKAKGRPPGSSKKQQLEALGSAGVGFTPHIITVKAGEDVSSKIMAFSQHGPRTVCILSANGSISNVTLRQAASSGGTATYEGRFDILSLSGSFLLTEVGGHRSRTGGLSVTLAGPDGRVLGGCVAGLLTAASPVQVIVGSFISDGRKDSKPVIQMEDLSAPPKLTLDGGVTSASSPPSRGTLSESYGGPGCPLNQSVGAYNNSNPQGISSMPWM